MLGPGPLPFNPFPKLPLYAVDGSTNIFLIDDRSYEQFYKERMALLEAEESESEGDPVPPPYDYPTNAWWIEILGVTNNLAYLTLHNTVTNQPYVMLTKSDLTWSNWTASCV